MDNEPLSLDRSVLFECPVNGQPRLKQKKKKRKAATSIAFRQDDRLYDSFVRLCTHAKQRGSQGFLSCVQLFTVTHFDLVMRIVISRVLRV